MLQSRCSATPAECISVGIGHLAIANPGSPTDTDVNIDLSVELQRIAGFGGMDGGFYPELTPAQVDSAFGNGPGQLGLSIIRVRVPETVDRFPLSGQRCSALRHLRSE